jgi:cytochrome c
MRQMRIYRQPDFLPNHWYGYRGQGRSAARKKISTDRAVLPKRHANALSTARLEHALYMSSLINLKKDRIMKTLLMVVAAASLLASSMGYAESGADVLKAKGCLGCHDIDKKKVGPAFKDVAAKYKGDKGAEAKLTAKLKEGKGHMKANASDAELKAALEHVLSLK